MMQVRTNWEDLIKAYDLQIRLNERKRTAALEDGDWWLAFDGLVESLHWRAFRLAATHRIDFPPSDADEWWEADALLLRDACGDVMRANPASTDRSDLHHKAEAISEILTALIDTKAVLREWQGVIHYPYRIAHQAVEIGSAEVGLGLAETGFWEDVARWKGQKRGRPEGFRIGWRVAAASVLQTWIDEEPKAKRIALMNKLYDWLKGYEETTPGFERPDFESLRKAISEMDKQGLIRLPKRKIGN
jgi:hypothetical protein